MEEVLEKKSFIRGKESDEEVIEHIFIEPVMALFFVDFYVIYDKTTNAR